jgi:uncharacterized NAD(P)/FAD-binding protein YdhS
MTKIAVVGAGFSGTLLALHLLRRCPPSVDITLIERAEQFGRGAAYATGNPNHLLNVPAGRMSAFHDRPRDFLDWLQSQGDPDCSPVTENCFVPRQRFGDYVRHLLNQELKDTGTGDRLQLIRGDVRAVTNNGDSLTLALDRGRQVTVDIGVLAVGNFLPEPPPVANPSFYDTGFYRADPWGSPTFADLDSQSPVMLIGTGLTMADALITLLDQGHEGPIYALSRRGLLPHRHVPSKTPAPQLEGVPTSLVELTRFLRSESAQATIDGAGWRPVIDQLRPFTLDVWASLSQADKARFLRHLRPWWEVHRHRMAGAVADRIDDARARGQLQVHAGRIRSYDLAGNRVNVNYRVRAKDEMRSLSVARVINCAGPGADYSRISDPLVKNLLTKGMIRPDPLNLGIDVTSNCAIRNSRGAISGRLFAVGPATKGAFWEMTAVPDIRRQCEFLAMHLGMLSARPKPKPGTMATQPYHAVGI